MQASEDTTHAGMDGNMSPAAQAGAEDTSPPTKPVIIVKITRNKLEAELQFQRSGTNTLDPDYDDVMAALAEKSVVYGIDEENLRQLCEKPVYNRTFIVARGKPPETGADGWLKYLIKTTRELRPKIREDGTADFKDIGFIQSVQQHQPLCEIHHPEKGADGCDVHGESIEGLFGKEATPMPAGGNTYYNEEKTMLYASTAGNVEFKNGIITIIEILKIAGNVDNSTGDISFPGDVIINGDVVSGFQVQSDKNITVRGSVEGATLRAKGDIAIGESMNGMNRGILEADGSIKCKYIQSCSLVRADKDIYADTIMYCTLECGGNLELSGKRGALIGGRASIAGKLSAKTIGTSTHTTTEINMCATGVGKNREAAQLETRIKEIDGEINKLVQVITRYEEISKKRKLDEDTIESIRKIKEQYVYLTQQRKDTQATLEKLKREQVEASQLNSFIECKDRVHTGVRVSFGAVSLVVTESFVRSRIHVVDGDVAVSPL